MHERQSVHLSLEVEVAAEQKSQIGSLKVMTSFVTKSKVAYYTPGSSRSTYKTILVHRKTVTILTNSSKEDKRSRCSLQHGDIEALQRIPLTD